MRPDERSSELQVHQLPMALPLIIAKTPARRVRVWHGFGPFHNKCDFTQGRVSMTQLGPTR